MFDLLIFLGLVVLGYFVWASGAPVMVRRVARMAARLEVLEAAVDGIKESGMQQKSWYGNALKAIKRIDDRLVDVDSRLTALEERVQSKDWEKELLASMLNLGQQPVDAEQKRSDITGKNLRKLSLGGE